MDSRRKSASMATECLDMFHGIDRTAFKMLTQSLHRDVTLSLMVMAFLLSLETFGLGSIVQHAITEGCCYMNKLADEYVICLQCLLSPVVPVQVDQKTNLDILRQACNTEVTISQIHGMRSVLLPRVKETLATIFPRILGDLTMNTVWLEFERNPARVLCFDTHVEGSSHAPYLLYRLNPARPMLLLQGGRQSQPEKGKQKYVSKELDEMEHPKTLTVCFGRESKPTAEAIAEFFTNWFGQVVDKVTVHPQKDIDSGEYAFVLFNDASISRIIMGDKNVVHHRIHGMKSWIKWWIGTHVRFLD